MKAILQFDTLGLKERFGQSLIVEADQTVFKRRLENLKKYIASLAPDAKLHEMGPRLAWNIHRPSKFKRDKAETVCIVVIEHDVSRETSPLASQLEEIVALQINELVDLYASNGLGQGAITTLFANAAYLVMEGRKQA